MTTRRSLLGVFDWDCTCTMFGCADDASFTSTKQMIEDEDGMKSGLLLGALLGPRHKRPRKAGHGPRLRSRSVGGGKRRTPESIALAAVLEALRLDRRVAWFARMNTGAVRTEDRFIRFGTPGLADVIGFLKDGRFLAIEVKAPTGKLTALQREFLLRGSQSGAVVGVARNAQDVQEIMDGRVFR